jgi:hypothetical protein
MSDQFNKEKMNDYEALRDATLNTWEKTNRNFDTNKFDVPDLNTVAKFMFWAWVVGVLISLFILVGGIYVIAHFLGKVW